MNDILESTWSDKVANDPKHRPQLFDRLSTTVRKEWCRRPQEAHIAEEDKYRRLSVEEIAIIQGFDPKWASVEGLTENEKIAVLGNAVPPPLAKSFGNVLEKSKSLSVNSSIEICAGIGGLSLGFPFLTPIAKIEMWDTACKVLREHFDPEVIIEGKAQDFDYSAHRGKVGLLCGGPPCQPWSQAGARQGNQDPRDVMGFTPTAVADCEPDVYIFENVPGLLSSKEHSEYRQELWEMLRNPKPGLSYGLDFKIINAADHGVPQVRKRVFIVGIKGQPDAKARRFLADVIAESTHHNPEKPAYQKKPWITLREALKGIVSTHPWRKWNIVASNGCEDIVDADESNDAQIIGPTLASSSMSASLTSLDQPDLSEIGIWWPKKNYALVFDDGRWRFRKREAKRNYRAILCDEKIVTEDGPQHFAIHGEYASSIEALSSIVKNSVKLVYWDMPRLDSDGDFAQHADPGYVRSAWMSLLRDVTRSSHKILAQQGFLAIQTDEESVHYARMVLDETFGASNHITTFAWEKKYSPQNDSPTPTDSFDYIVVYSTLNKESITEKIGIVVEKKKVIEDGDPRGSYTAGHKGARSGNENTKFKVNVPPYHWKLTGHKLPDCEWHVFDELTGVLRIEKPKSHGAFYIETECVDADGNKAEQKICFRIKEKEPKNGVWAELDSVWWLFKDDYKAVSSKQTLQIDSKEGPDGFIGKPYSLILEASGGTPFTGKHDQPGSGRFWDMSRSTLVGHIVKAAASFGTKGTALPSEKKFMDRSETTSRKAVRNWLPWAEMGKSEDATRHLKNLAEIGYGAPFERAYAKPEQLTAHMILLFAPNTDDAVLTIDDGYGTMCASAIKLGRPIINLVGPSDVSANLWQKTALPRVMAIKDGKDIWGITELYQGGDQESSLQNKFGTLRICHLSRSSVLRKGVSDISFDMDKTESYRDFIASLRGYLPDTKSPTGYSDRDGNRCLVIDPEQILDQLLIAEAESMIPLHGELVVLYERSDLSDEINHNPKIRLIRVPFEVD